MINNGAFVFSFDFELFWGVHHNKSLMSYKDNLDGALKFLPNISKEFLDHEAYFTCATVGMIYNNDWEEWEENIPVLIPTHNKSELSPFTKINFFKENVDKKYFFAKNILETIRKDGQEIATHTYSHYFCLEKDDLIENFECDIKKALFVADKATDRIASIVFPRNQFRNEHLLICKELGIRVYRGNPDSGLFDKSSNRASATFKKIIRYLDSFINISGSNTFVPQVESCGLTNVQSSFFLRFPSSLNSTLLNKLHLLRIKKAMSYAAKHNKVIHIWCHPHNIKSQQDLESIKVLLKHYSSLSKMYDFRSMKMCDF